MVIPRLGALGDYVMSFSLTEFFFLSCIFNYLIISMQLFVLRKKYRSYNKNRNRNSGLVLMTHRVTS